MYVCVYIYIYIYLSLSLSIYIYMYNNIQKSQTPVSSHQAEPAQRDGAQRGGGVALLLGDQQPLY